MILTRRRAIMIFISVFLFMEFILLMIHELWLLPEPVVVDKQTPSIPLYRLAAAHRKNPLHNAPRHTKLVLPKHKRIAEEKDKLSLRWNMNINQDIAFQIESGEKRVAVAQPPRGEALGNKMQMIGSHKANKKKAKKQRGWDPGAEGQGKDPTPLKVQTPIFVASLPKSGTTSIWQYFNCGARLASHQWVKSADGVIQAGMCIRENIALGQAPFQGCGKYDVYTDTGFSLNIASGIADCYYPSISALDAIYEHYPDATIILITRNSTSWLNSMQTWGDGTLLKRWRFCNMTGHLSRTPDDPYAFRAFYEWHTEHIRRFATKHSSLAYIEVALESARVGRVLEEKIGIPARCWGRCSPASKFCDRIAAEG